MKLFFVASRREFEALPAKERDRLLSKKKMSQKQSQMKKQADGNTEDGPPGEKKSLTCNFLLEYLVNIHH